MSKPDDAGLLPLALSLIALALVLTFAALTGGPVGAPGNPSPTTTQEP